MAWRGGLCVEYHQQAPRRANANANGTIATAYCRILMPGPEWDVFGSRLLAPGYWLPNKGLSPNGNVYAFCVENLHSERKQQKKHCPCKIP